MKLRTNINLLLRVKSFNKGIVANHKEKKKKKKKEKRKTTLQCCNEREREGTYRPQRGETRLSFTVNHGSALFIVSPAPPRWRIVKIRSSVRWRIHKSPVLFVSSLQKQEEDPPLLETWRSERWDDRGEIFRRQVAPEDGKKRGRENADGRRPRQPTFYIRKRSSSCYYVSPTLCRPTAIYNYTNNLKAKAEMFGRVSFSFVQLDASNPLVLLESFSSLSKQDPILSISFFRIPRDKKKKNSEKSSKGWSLDALLFLLPTVMQHFRPISSLLNGRN